MFTRGIIRLALAISFVISTSAIYFSIREIGLNNSETWVLVAASLAVITSIFSAYSSQKLVEIEEDSKEPEIFVEFDPYSRYSLLQFVVKNVGENPAKNIILHFDRNIDRQSGGNIHFGSEDGLTKIDVLQPGEKVGQLVGTSIWFFESHADTLFTGKISYENFRGKRFNKNFALSAEQYRSALNHDNEMVKTLRDLQEIPDLLRQIRDQLRGN